MREIPRNIEIKFNQIWVFPIPMTVVSVRCILIWMDREYAPRHIGDKSDQNQIPLSLHASARLKLVSFHRFWSRIVIDAPCSIG